MAESNLDIADQFESRILQLNSRRILFEGKHRWLRPDEICEVLRNPNEVAISKEPAVMPPSGSIFLFDKKVQKHFRNDGYKWKKAKDGRTKEGHEKLKVEGLDTLHCYYAHGEEDQNFQRRSYWMLEENLSHMVLVHYRDVKGEKRKARYIEETETAEGVQHSHETDETTPNSEMDSFASFSFNPSNFQHSQATDGTNLNSAQTSESENTESAYNHQASFGLPPLPKLQHAKAKINAGFLDTLISTNCNEREVKDAVSSCFVPANFQMLSQAIDTESLSGLSTSDFEDAQSACDDYRWESFFNNTVTTGFSDTTSLYSANSSNFGDDETEQSLADDFWEILVETSFDNHVTAGFSPWTYSRASSSVAVEPSPLGKRQRDSFASEVRKSWATYNAIMEEVDKEKDEEEEGNDINQVRKRPKVTCGQKVDSATQSHSRLEWMYPPMHSNSVAPSNNSEEATLAVGTAPPQVQEFNFAIQQGEVIAGNNPAASDVAVTIDRAITDGAMNDTTALSQANAYVSNVVVVSSVHVDGTTRSVPPPGVNVAMAPTDVQAPIGVLPEPMTFPEKTIKGDGVSLNGAQTLEVVPPHVILSPEEQASIEEWVSWHETFNTLKDSIRNGARVLSSIEELLPQGEAFTSHVDFRNTKVRYGLADILNRFLERVGDADERLIGLSPYMRGMVFEELGILLYDMEHTPPVEVSEHRLLCWRDMINDVAALGVPVSSLIESLEKSRDTMFGLHLEEDKGILDQFVKVNELERVLELQRKELEAEKLKLKKLVRGSSKEIADCLQIAADHLSAGTSGSFKGA